MQRLLIVGLSALLSMAVWAESAPAANDIEVIDPTVRVPIPGKNSTGAYFLLRNSGSEPRQLVGAEVDFAKRAEIHSHSMEDGMMRMRKEDAVTIPGRDELRFSSGGYHVMIFELDRRPRTGDPLELVLEFDDGSKKTVTARAVSVFDEPHH